MKKLLQVVVVISIAALLAACSTTGQKTKKLKLGMTPEDVRKEIGEPATIRAAKLYEDGRKAQVWEYVPSFSLTPRTYWVFFENDKLVQWGQPGDFAGKSGASVPVDEYTPLKKTQ
ncbi:MAG: hypothetical protein V1929_13630 [bacterium]